MIRVLSFRPVSFCKLSFGIAALALSFGFAPRAVAQQAADVDRLIRTAGSLHTRAQVVEPIDENTLSTVYGAHDPRANARTDRGIVEDTLPMEHIQLVLHRPVETQAAFDAAVEQLHRPGSPTYHKWMTPEQIGAEYGPSNADIARLTDWLQDKGFRINFVNKSGMIVDFDGNAGKVRDAFHVEIHHVASKEGLQTAAIGDAKLPAAFRELVAGFPSLSSFKAKPQMIRRGDVKYDPKSRTGTLIPETVKKDDPNFTFTCPAAICGAAVKEYTVGATDFYTIYNETPLLTGGTPITGSGQTVAVLEESDINTADVTTFRTAFGVTPSTPSLTVAHGTTAVTCTDPGKLDTSTDAEESEADIDADWAGAAAPGATILFESCASTAAVQGVLLAAEAVVDGNLAGSASLSYGLPEAILTGSGGPVPTYGPNALWNSLWQQAAAQGITITVSSGDSGVALEDDIYGDTLGGLSMATTYGQTVNGLGSTPYNISAGGTDFQDYYNYVLSGSTGNWISNYWNTTANTTAPFSSAKSYVPETAWDSTCANSLLASYFTFLGELSSANNNPYTSCNTGFAYYENNGGNAYAVQLNGGGGGLSTLYAQPSWQTGVYGISAVDTTGKRALPDVSLFASNGYWNHSLMYCDSDPYGGDGATAVPCTYTSATDSIYQSAGGTSFVAPQLAGVIALVEQKTGERQGQANYVLYKLAGTTYGSTTDAGVCLATGTTSNTGVGSSATYTPSSSCMFQDVTSGNNNQPCYAKKVKGATTTPEDPACYATATGAYTGGTTTYYIGAMSTSTTAFNSTYNSGVGYDLATGLGSINIANIVNNWQTAADGGVYTATVSLSGAPASFTYGNPPAAATLSSTVTGSASYPTGSVTFSGTPPIGTIGTDSFPNNGCSTQTGASGPSGANCPDTGSQTVTQSYAASATLPPLTYTLTAAYNPNENYISNLATATFTVSQQTPTVAITQVSPANENYGAGSPVSVTGTLTYTGSGTAPTVGDISFTSTAAGTVFIPINCTLASHVYTCSEIFLPTATDTVGYYAFNLSFSGDTNYASAATTVVGNSTSYNFTISRTTPTFGTMTFSPAATEVYGTSQAITISDTLSYTGGGVAPGGSGVTFTLNGVSYPATCGTGASPVTCSATVPAATIAVLPVGTYTVTAALAAGVNYTAATGASGTFSITQAQPTITSVVISPSTLTPLTAGTVTANITFPGSGAAPTGAVTFMASNNSLGQASATFGTVTCTGTTSPYSCQASITPAGTDTPGVQYTVTATLAAAGNYKSASNSGTWTYALASITYTNSPSASPTNPYYNQADTFSVSRSYVGATAPTGAFTFVFTNTATSATVTISGTCTGTGTQTCTANEQVQLVAGSYTYYGHSAADSNYAAANSSTSNITVTKQFLANAQTSASPSSVTYGGTEMLTDTLSPIQADTDGALAPTGTVQFYIDGSATAAASCPLPGTTGATEACTANLTANLAPGPHSVVSTYSGDSNYQSFTTTGSADASFTVTQGTATLSLTGNANGTAAVGTVSDTLTATLSPAVSGVTVTFTNASTGVSTTAQTNGSGVATLTVTDTDGVTPAGYNSFTASVAASTDYTSATSGAVAVYVQGLLVSIDLKHNFSTDPGTVDGSPVCNGSNGTAGSTCTNGFTVVVTNFATSSNPFSLNFTNSAASAFSYTTNCPVTLTSNQQCDVNFYYLPPYGDGTNTASSPACSSSPSTCGAYEQGTWLVTSATSGGINTGVGLYSSSTGVGTTRYGANTTAILAGKALLPTAAPISVTPTSLSFGPEAIGEQSASQNVTVTNNGSNAIALTYHAPTSNAYLVSNGCPSSLAAGASCQVSFAFKDSMGGTVTDTFVVIPAAQTGLAVTVNLTGTASNPSGITLSTNTHNFGTVATGTTNSFGLSISNTSGASQTISFSNAAAAGFTVNSSGCPATLANNASCTVSVTYAPTQAGSTTDTLTVTSSSPILPGGTSSSPYTAPVTFSGTATANAAFTISTYIHNFGDTPVGSAASDYGVTLTNTTGGTLNLTFGTLAGNDGFSNISTSCGATLASNQSCNLTFGFTPTMTGYVSDSLSISATTGPSNSPVTLYYGYGTANQAAVTAVQLRGTGQ